MIYLVKGKAPKVVITSRSTQEEATAPIAPSAEALDSSTIIAQHLLPIH